MKSLVLKILAGFAILIPLDEVRAAGEARGVVLYDEPPATYVMALEFDTLKTTSVEFTTATLSNGTKEEIRRSGVVAVIDYPPDAPIGSFANDAEAAIRNIQALRAKYPQCAVKLNKALAKWADTLAPYQQRQKSAGAAAAPESPRGAVLEIDGKKYTEVVLTSFDGVHVEFEHSAGFARIPAAKLTPAQVAALNGTTSSVRIDASKIAASAATSTTAPGAAPAPAPVAEIDPVAIAKLRSQALADAEAHRFQEAVQTISAAIKADPKTPSLLQTLAVIGNAQAAEQQLERAKADKTRIAADAARLQRNAAVTNRPDPLNPNDSSGRQRSDAMRAEADRMERDATRAVENAENQFRAALKNVESESQNIVNASRKREMDQKQEERTAKLKQEQEERTAKLKHEEEERTAKLKVFAAKWEPEFASQVTPPGLPLDGAKFENLPDGSPGYQKTVDFINGTLGGGKQLAYSENLKKLIVMGPEGDVFGHFAILSGCSE